MNLSAITRVSRPLLVANVIMVGLALFFAVFLTRELTHSRPVPALASRQTRPAAATENPERPAGANDRLDSYNVIVAKHLFNPARAENAAVVAAAPTAPPPVKPLLHGVILDGAASLAYLEDPVSKRVLVYRIGDTVGGGKLVQIGEDRVSIARPDAQVDVLLKDPAKPHPVPTAGQPGQPVPPARATRGSGFVNPPTAQPPGAVQGAQSPSRVPPTAPAPAEANNPPQPGQAEE